MLKMKQRCLICCRLSDSLEQIQLVPVVQRVDSTTVFSISGGRQYGPFPWKRSNPCIFVLEWGRQIQNFEPKLRKKVWILSFFTLQLPEEAKKTDIFLKFQKGVKKTNIFKCKPPEGHLTIRNRVPYNKQLTKRACSGRTGEYWPSVVVFVQTEHSELPRPRANIPQYGPHARLVSG